MNRSAARRLARTTLAVVAASACASGPRLERFGPTAGDRFFVAGYHPYWAGNAWTAYPWDALDEVYFFEIEVGGDGTIADPHGWPDAGLLARAREERVRIVPTVSLHDAVTFSTLFSAPTSAAHLVDELIVLLQATPDLAGLHLDFEVFEPVALDVRDGYTAFVARLARRMRETNPVWSLSVFALAFDDDDVFNERALAESADFLVVQGYDFHSRTEPRAGPLAALSGWERLNWETVVDRFLGFGIPARKLVMAVPLYGYQWPAASDLPGADTRGIAVEIPLTAGADVVPELPRALAQAELYGLRRDPASGSPYYAFRDSSGWHQGWFEDAESLRAKYAFVRTHGLGGVALFPLAYGDAPLWEDLRQAFSRPRE
ncbi:MAG: glycosyl hydrolase family 18 protein [Gemmatimonadales bacterium]